MYLIASPLEARRSARTARAMRGSGIPLPASKNPLESNTEALRVYKHTAPQRLGGISGGFVTRENMVLAGRRRSKKRQVL